jgi:hypothetical protein
MTRWRRSVLVVVPLVAAVLFGSPGLAAAQAAPYCQTADALAFQGGFAQLQGAVGEAMGVPVECAHVDPASGDIVQNTTTGLAYARSATGIPTFTNGSHRWALTPNGLVEWDDASLDPPGVMVPPVPLPPAVPGVPVPPPVPGVPLVPDVPAPPMVPGVPDVPPVPQPGTAPQAPPVPGAPSIPAIPGVPGVPAVPGVPGVPPIPSP